MRYAYYPGCSLHSTGLEYDLSTRRVAKHLGLELWEIPDWNCCGASAAHNTNHTLALALPARNLAIAEQEGLDVAIPCAACFNRMRAAQAAARNSEAMRQTINDIIGTQYRASNEAYSLLDIIVNRVGLETIKEKVVKPLTGLKVAAYYGCLLVRPPEITGFDDPENPQSLDRLVAALGGMPVDWSFKIECCGAGHTTTRPDIASRLLYRLYSGAAGAGADCFVVACPLCFLNLDMRQEQVGREHHASFNLPVFYFTELMGLAFAYAPKDLGVNRHFLPVTPLLESKELLRHPATRREEA